MGLGSVSFALLLALLLAGGIGGEAGAGSGALGQSPGAAPLQVNLRLAQGPTTTPLDSVALMALVTSAGEPVPGAVVAFNDAHNSAFNEHGSTATTNSSGVAVASIRLVSPFPGKDTITAYATAAGYDGGNGTVAVNVLPFGIQQLAVTATVFNIGASGGSSGVLQGKVGTVDSSTSDVIANVGAFWSPAISGVYGANLTITDTIGSEFQSKTVTTDANGFYSVNFTLGTPKAGVVDVLTVNASRATYNGSESSFAFTVGPYGPDSLTVRLDSISPPVYSTVMNSATIQARVSAEGRPVAGVPVTFSDSLGSLFQGSVATTDATGTATTLVYFTSQGAGLDLFTARASLEGASPGSASNTLSVRPFGQSQLSVSESVDTTNPVAGSTDRVSGKVGWVGTMAMYAWSPSQTVVPGVTVVVTDSLGSFAPITVSTDASGAYSVTFAVPDTGGAPDVIQASASGTGYHGSASSLFIVPGSVQPPLTTSASSASTASAAPIAPQSSSSTSSSGSTSGGARSPSWSGADVAIAVVVGAAGVVVISGLARVARRHGRAS